MASTNLSSQPPHPAASARDDVTRPGSAPKRRALVVSYHVQPDSAVGGLRPAALIRTLREAGWHVTVIMRSVPDAREFWAPDGHVAVRTVRDTIRITDTLVRTLRAIAAGFQRFVGNAEQAHDAVAQASAEPAQHDSIVSAPRESVLMRLERYFHASLWFVDRYKLWSAIALVRALALLRRGRFDLVVSSGPPMSPHIAASLVARWTGAPHAIDLRDPWVSGSASLPEYKVQLFDDLTMRIFRNCVANARALIGASPGIVRVSAAAAAGLATPMHLVMNGFSGEPRLRNAPLGYLHLFYTGTLYLERNPFQLLEAMDRLLERGSVAMDKVRITFIGACASWNGIDVRAWAEGRPVGRILQIRDFVAREELPSLMATANVCINLAQRQPLQIPAKTFEYLGDGIEMLVLAEDDSDTTRLVEAAGGGQCVDGANGAAVEAAILDLYRRYAVGDDGYRFDLARRRRYSRAAQNLRFLEIVQALTDTVRASAT